MEKFDIIKRAVMEELDAYRDETEKDELLVTVSVRAFLVKDDDGRPWRVTCQRESYRELGEPPRRR